MNDDSDTNIRSRLSRVAKNHQEPKDRLWSTVIILMFITLLVGAISVFSWRASETGNQLVKAGQTIGFQRGAVDCLTTVIDNDRTFEIPDYCRRGEVIQWYPPEVCIKFFSTNSVCGVKWGTG